MRNWNNEKVSCECFQHSEFSAYLWGIETIEFFRIEIGNTLFSAYLWGIETQKSVLPQDLNCRFQRTYEELKLLIFRPRTVSTAGFQRTYEELKLIPLFILWAYFPVFSVPMRNWNEKAIVDKVYDGKRFQRTYEELKPTRWPFSLPWDIGVFSVPMRNWNSDRPSLFPR